MAQNDKICVRGVYSVFVIRNEYDDDDYDGISDNDDDDTFIITMIMIIRVMIGDNGSGMLEANEHQGGTDQQEVQCHARRDLFLFVRIMILC